MTAVTIDIDVYCDTCDNELEVYWNEHYERLDAKPCEFCLDMAVGDAEVECAECGGTLDSDSDDKSTVTVQLCPGCIEEARQQAVKEAEA